MERRIFIVIIYIIQCCEPYFIGYFAILADIELVLIDEETRLDQLRDRLRWDAAYFRLRQGL